jgi:DNA repair exonuclease SbcCD nuclease subunit
MRPYGLIGDAHQGFKAYGSERRTQEAIDVLAQSLLLLKDKPIVFFAGDFFDDTVVSNWVKKQIIALKEDYHTQEWVILGGNHDSTKTYSSVSALDVLGEVANITVVNSHKQEIIELCGLRILCIPHVKSQTEYLKLIDDCIGADDAWDVCLLHSLVNSNLDLGPNDLNLDLYRLDLLSQKCGTIWIGHQHHPVELIRGKAYIPGSIMEFDFGQLGDKFVYTESDTLLLEQPRKMVRMELEPMTPMELVQTLKLTEDSIYRIDIKSIPIEDYSNIKSACDLIETQFSGDVLFNLYKLGHKELQVTAIDARFDLLDEFDSFCVANNVEVGRMKDILTDAVAEVLMEEEDE